MTVAPRFFRCCSAHLWPIARPFISGRGSIPSVLDVRQIQESQRNQRIAALNYVIAFAWVSDSR
jgi:hypothetical protein